MSENIVSRMENMLFDFETTNRTDFLPNEITAPILTAFKKKPTCLMSRPLPLKNIHTMSDWKNAAIPFNLLHKPKATINTDPRNIQEPCTKSPDRGLVKAQKTRPRLVMTPAVSIDDIDDPGARAIVCNDVYTSAMTRALPAALASYSSIRAPLPGHPAAANPINLPKLKEPYVSPEWRMDSVTWDTKQLRCRCNPTDEFWMRRPIPKCRMCEEFAIVQAHRKMMGGRK